MVKRTTESTKQEKKNKEGDDIFGNSDDDMFSGPPLGAGSAGSSGGPGGAPPVIPGLDGPGQAIVAALQGSLASINNNVAVLNDNVAAFRADVDNRFRVVDGRFQAQDLRMDQIERMAKAAQDGASSCASTAAGGSVNGSVRARNPYSGGSNDLDNQFNLAPSRRRVLAVGGFPANPDAEDINEYFKTLKADHTGLVDAFARGRLASTGRLVFSTNENMWGFLKRMKGKKLVYQGSNLWHGIDKSPEEQLRSRRVTLLTQGIAELALEAGKTDSLTPVVAKTYVEGEHHIGYVWVKRTHDDIKMNVRIFERAPHAEEFILCIEAAAKSGLNEEKLKRILDAGNAVAPRFS